MIKRKRIRLSLILLILILSYQSSINSISSSSYHSPLRILVQKAETPFFLSNTTEPLGIGALGTSIPFVGETWNLTIKVEANSTSGVEVLYEKFTNSRIMWEYWVGALEFQVLPAQIQTETYVSHIEADTTDFPYFKLVLLNGSESASGSYTKIRVFEGYFIAELGTGFTYVEDIEAWLQRKALQYHLLQIGQGVLVMALILIPIVILKRMWNNYRIVKK